MKSDLFPLVSPQQSYPGETSRSHPMIGHRLRGSEMKLRRSRSGSMGRSRRGSRPWVLEGLEERLLLATIYTVNSTGSGTSGMGDSGTLPYVIGQANANANPAGSEIEFDPTVFATPQTITLTNTLEVYNPNVPEVIDGPGASLASFSGNHAVVVFTVGGDAVTIAGLTIEDGSNPGLDAIGGGIVSGGTLTVNDCTITNNLTGDFGGGIGNDGTLSVNDCTFSQNSARVHGGGIGNINGEVTVTDSTISDNSGGGFWETGGKLTILDSSVVDNSGPGISATSGGNHSGTVSVSGCAIAGTRANAAAASSSATGHSRSSTAPSPTTRPPNPAAALR
jgi:hypothetical protein